MKDDKYWNWKLVVALIEEIMIFIIGCALLLVGTFNLL